MSVCPIHGIPDCSPLLNGCTELTKPTPADTLRQAAEVLRERAGKASKPPWKYPYRGFPGVVGSKNGCLWTSGSHSGQINNEVDAEWIAILSPDVGLLLADLLESLARGLDKRGVTARITAAEVTGLALARRIVGGAE